MRLNHQSLKNISGFTLIELVAVIVLLGILAVTAAPRFVGLSQDAKNASAKATAGALQSGLHLINMKFFIGGNNQVLDNIPSAGSQTVTTTEGWPNLICNVNALPPLHGADPGCNYNNLYNNQRARYASASPDTNRCARIWYLVLNNEPSISVASSCSASNKTCDWISLPVTATACRYQDDQGTGKNVITYDIATGQVSLATSP